MERNLAERLGLEDGLRGSASTPAESQANFVWFGLPDAEADERRSRSPASPSAACSCAPVGRSAAPARYA